MPTLTSVSTASMNEGATFTYSYSTLKLRANESTDAVRFKITNIPSSVFNMYSPDGKLLTFSGGVPYIDGVEVSELWYYSDGLNVIPITGINDSYVITGSVYLNTANKDYYGLSVAFTIRAGTVVGATGADISTTDVNASINVLAVDDPHTGSVFITSNGNIRSPAAGNIVTANSTINDVDVNFTTGSVTPSFYLDKSTDYGVTWVNGTSSVSANYTLTASDVVAGAMLRFRANYSDAGNQRSIISSNTVPELHNFHYKVGSNWRRCSQIFIKDADTYKMVKEVYVKEGGVWRKT